MLISCVLVTLVCHLSLKCVFRFSVHQLRVIVIRFNYYKTTSFLGKYQEYCSSPKIKYSKINRATYKVNEGMRQQRK